MNINLLTEPMLSHWRTATGVWQCEFQFGTQLIYVQHHDNESPHARLAEAQRAVKDVWDDLPQALKFAEQYCKLQMSELMRLYETHMSWESPLFVYSVHFDLDKPQPRYVISKNPDFDWDRTLVGQDELCQEYSVCMKRYEPGDDFWIYVTRVGFQRFEIGE